jgi:hypothetical protein
MSGVKENKEGDVFQLGDLFQELIRYNLQKKPAVVKKPEGEVLNGENGQAGAHGQDPRGDSAKKTKKPFKFPSKIVNPEDIAFGPNSEAVDHRNFDKGMEFAGKSTNFLNDGASNFLKPAEYSFSKQPPSITDVEAADEEDLLFFQISEENLLSFLGIQSNEADEEDPNVVSDFDNFGNPLLRLDVNKVLADFKQSNFQLTSDFKKSAQLTLDGRTLNMESFTPPTGTDTRLARVDIEGKSIKIENKINNFFVAL